MLQSPRFDEQFVIQDKGDPSLASVTYAANTKDESYLQLLLEVKAEPMRYPRLNVVGGQLYSYSSDPLVQEVMVVLGKSSPRPREGKKSSMIVTMTPHQDTWAERRR